MKDYSEEEIKKMESAISHVRKILPQMIGATQKIDGMRRKLDEQDTDFEKIQKKLDESIIDFERMDFIGGVKRNYDGEEYFD